MIRVSVAVALPGRQEVVDLELPQGATAADAIDAARLGERFPELDFSSVALGIWSRPCAAGAPLREGDRVEVYRPLAVDAKAERRKRARLNPFSTRPRNAR